MAPAVQTVSIHGLLTPEAQSFIGELLRLIWFWILGGGAGYAVSVIGPCLWKTMANSWYKRQRRMFANEDRSRFVQMNGALYRSWGNVPRVYNTARTTFWIMRHYYPIIASLMAAKGSTDTERILDRLPRAWWEGLDPYADHILVLEGVRQDERRPLADGQAVLWAWLREVHPHDALPAHMGWIDPPVGSSPLGNYIP
jgi:hypothetical protein